MTLDLETRLRRAAEHLDEVVTARMTERPTVIDLARPPTPRRRWIAAAAAATVVLVGGTLVVTVANRNDDPPATNPTVPPTAPAPTTPPPTTEPPSAGSTWLHEGWNELPIAPISARYDHHTIATGRGVLLWGGVKLTKQAGSAMSLDDGAFLDTATGRWTKTPPAPSSSRGTSGDEIGVAVGDEVIFLVENSDTLESFSYKTSTNTWESIAGPPDSIWPGPALGAFTVGDDVIFVRQARRADAADDEPFEAGAVAIFDTTSRTWSEGSAPADTLSAPREGNVGLWGTVAGDRVVVAFPTGTTFEDRCQPPMFSYEPSADEWQPLDIDTSGASAPIGGLTFTGSELFGAASAECVVFDGPSEQVTQPQAVLTNLVTGSSRTVDAPALVTSADGSWTGSLVATTGDRGDPLFYDPERDRWHAAPLNTDVSGLRVDIHREWVLVGGAMVAWGGIRGDPTATPTADRAVADGYAYVPPADLGE